MRQLDVYINDIKAGILTELKRGKRYSFCYDREFLHENLPAVSRTLPKREEEYITEVLFPFFTNMLPEGHNRQVICKTLKIDESDLFGLLDAMADKDFIGAVNVRKIKNDKDR